MSNLVRDRGVSVQRFALFSGLTLADCTSITSTAQDRSFTRRQTIFFEGAPIRQILLITSGHVKVSQSGQNGAEVILRLDGPGKILGGMGLQAEGDHSATAQALQSATALVWETSAFESLSERFPLLRRNITRMLEERLQELQQRFREVSTEKVGLRLSSELIRLQEQVGKQVDGDVEISLSREELAQLIGTTLFTVSRLLCQWELLGIVSPRREAVLVKNLPALIEMSQRS
jgi:CRP-like cAMP-binding protein